MENLAHITNNEKLYPCCREQSNLEKKDSGKPDLDLHVCKACGRRHFRLRAEPGVIFNKEKIELKDCIAVDRPGDPPHRF